MIHGYARVGLERTNILESRFQQFFISFIVAPAIFCQKEDSSSRMAGNWLEHSTILIADL